MLSLHTAPINAPRNAAARWRPNFGRWLTGAGYANFAPILASLLPHSRAGLTAQQAEPVNRPSAASSPLANRRSSAPSLSRGAGVRSAHIAALGCRCQQYLYIALETSCGDRTERVL